MTTWNELRTVALVGTERRPLPDAPRGSLPHGPAAPVDPEHAALQAAALLGVGRRAAAPPGAGEQRPDPENRLPVAEEARPTPETVAPDQAWQLLELLLTGNTGPGLMSAELLAQWFRRCGQYRAVVPHSLLVPVLDAATSDPDLRETVLPTLGQRGRWLGTRRDKWSWATHPAASARTDGYPQHAPDPGSPDGEHPTPASAPALEDLLELPADQRDATLRRARVGDAAAGRRLIAEACTKLDAASRARVLSCLAGELDDDDEELLEAALDDRSKAVRSIAIELLNRLTSSDRSARLTRQLAPLVGKRGRLRTQIEIAYPGPPEGEQLRDLPPTGDGVVEKLWLDALIAATPLGWWEDTLNMTPKKLIGSTTTLGTDLTTAWMAAAVNQDNRSWLHALFDHTKDPTLIRYVGGDAAAAAFRVGVGGKMKLEHQAALLRGVPGPWTIEFSNEVLRWVVDSGETSAHLRVKTTQRTLADRLHTQTQATLMAWLDSAGDEHEQWQLSLRNIIQQLSLQTSIDKAFL